MCGIIGCVGKGNVVQKVIEGLKKLEYRGYDSAGIAAIQGNKIVTVKEIGKIEEIEKKLNISQLSAPVALAHRRWSTHGAVTQENAHPHTDCTKKISLVHNGIIENFDELKEMLVEKGHRFSSATDTEVIVHLIEDFYKGDLKRAVMKILTLIQGTYALGVFHVDEPDKIVATKNESPLVIGLAKNENYIASDVPAILKYTNKVVYLEDHEIAEITNHNVEIFDPHGNIITKKIHTIDWDREATEKKGYKHFMLKEIFEQPWVIEETLKGRLLDHAIDLKDELLLSDNDIKGISEIIIVGCGTSWHASLFGRFILEGISKIQTHVEYASEFRYKEPLLNPHTLVIAISQSGETADTLAAIKKAKEFGANVLSIVNVKGSSIDRESDMRLYTYAGPEIGVASTKAFTCQMITLYLLTLYLGRIRNTVHERILHDAVDGLRKIPLQLQSVLEESSLVKDLAKLFCQKTNAMYLGRGANFPIALEGALKLKEVSYIHAEGYPAAEMKHGPIALIDKDMPVVFLATKDINTYPKILGNIEEVKARGGEIIAIATKGDKIIESKADHVFYVPDNLYTLEPILSVVLLQLFAYYIADLRKCNVDKPRNLAKSVTVE